MLKPTQDSKVWAKPDEVYRTFLFLVEYWEEPRAQNFLFLSRLLIGFYIHSLYSLAQVVSDANIGELPLPSLGSGRGFQEQNKVTEFPGS
ncbi:hypothetical protein [Desulfotruncus arcticus]|uniref:hypothetical protein n=1 Tax=Desulfotruncus arcticus TaxID=341036 RepID=UPI000B87E6B4|nr:hypothetical protein [Desulfotruncus arcticus]